MVTPCSAEACLEFASSGHDSSAADEARASLWPMPGAFLWETFSSSLVAAPSPELTFRSRCLLGASVGDALSWEGSFLVASFGSSASLSHGLVCLGTSCAVFSRCPVLSCCGDLRILGGPYPPLTVRRLCVSCFSSSGKQVLQASVLEKRPIQVPCRHPMD